MTTGDSFTCTHWFRVLGFKFQISFCGSDSIFALKDKLFFSCDPNGVHSISDF
jgi:hypothetical protein